MMKINNILFVFALVVLLGSCGTRQLVTTDSSHPQVLHDTAGWHIENIADGLVHYVYEGSYAAYNSSQRVDVLLVDPHKNRLVFDDGLPNDSLSARVQRYVGAVAGINGTYYEMPRTEQGDTLYSSFFKKDGQISTSVTVPEGHRLFWKHEGAFYYDAEEQSWGIIYGDAAIYDKLPYANAMSGSPMLIYDDEPVGLDFAQSHHVPLDSLDYEHPDRHQGVRHPRTAVAITPEGHVLLVTVDGRRPETTGMSAKELTQFLQRFFKPRYALNLDGGGSTTMWIKDSGSPNGVVNYPTDNKRYDHFGQRRIRNGIIVIR